MKKILYLILSIFVFGCNSMDNSPGIHVKPDVGNGGISLPEGFMATVFADSLGRTRHIAVNSNGDVYTILRSLHEGKGMVALRDTDGDGHADQKMYFGDVTGTGIRIYNNYLYFSSDSAIYRLPLDDQNLIPEWNPELIVSGLPQQTQHAAKSFAFDGDGNLYINIGAPANACQEQMRTPGSPGREPCPLLERHGGIWRFSADKPGQTQLNDGYRFSTGIRNAVAIDFNAVSDHVYIVQHGRDQLHQFFPELYSQEQGAELPSEEFFMLTDGADFGWPYCYYDQIQDRKVLAPEYGGDGQESGLCEKKVGPIMAFPGHWAPNALLFYTGTMFPQKYRSGAFIAFHGSWNRAPVQKGYKVVFVPFDGQLPAEDYEIFADGFPETENIESPADAKYRPTGLAAGPDGAVYITDDNVGRIWKVYYSAE